MVARTYRHMASSNTKYYHATFQAPTFRRQLTIRIRRRHRFYQLVMFVPGRDRANQVSELGGVVADVTYRIDEEWKTTLNEGRAGLSRRVPPSSRAPDRRYSTAAVDAAQ